MIKKGRTAFIITFLAPALLLYVVFVAWPLVQAFALSFYRWKGLSPKRDFVGLGNYKDLWHDEVFWKSLSNNLWLMVVGGFVIIALAILLAHGMQGKGKAIRALRGLYLFPQVISLVVVAIIWQFLYNPSYGLVTGGISALGLQGYDEPLGKSSQALTAVGVAFVWYALGFYIMLFSAGLKQIPEEVNEAAALDGSSGFHRFKTITWPMLWSIKRISVIYIVINVLNIFALVYLMTKGGPNRSTETLLTYLYEQAFTNSKYGYGTTIAAANFVIAMVLALILMFIFRKNPEGGRA